MNFETTIRESLKFESVLRMSKWNGYKEALEMFNNRRDSRLKSRME